MRVRLETLGVNHLIGVDGLLRLYMAQVRAIKEGRPITWMSGIHYHFFMLLNGIKQQQHEQ